MATPPHPLLSRWASLEDGSGTRRAARLLTMLRILAGLAFLLLAWGSYVGWPPIAIAFLGIVTGYLLAERHALEARWRDWPVARQYIDWPRVRHACGHDPASPQGTGNSPG